jgi:hypothetical protein
MTGGQNSNRLNIGTIDTPAHSMHTKGGTAYRFKINTFIKIQAKIKGGYL